MDCNINIDFNKFSIENTYYRKNKKCIFDPIREILIVETPEEIIRQKFVRYLMEELKVPKNKIEIEVPMTHFKKGAKGRADIVVYAEDKEGCLFPLIVVECKAPDVLLIDEVWLQVYKYDDILQSGFIIITNGGFNYAAVWDEEEKKYFYIEELLDYEQLLKEKEFKFIQEESDVWKRPDFKNLLSKEVIEKFDSFGWIGEDTNKSLYPFIINFTGFLQDPEIRCSPFMTRDLNVVDDGHRYTSFGNVAGGNWVGDYRYFILKDNEGNNQIISISVFGSLKCTDHPRFGNRKGHTTLVVAIDDYNKRHNSLQLNLDKYIEVKGNKYKIWHDGTLTVGKNGAAKRKEVIEFIRKQAPFMIDSNDKIIFGTLDCSKEIHWDDDTKKIINNLIVYSILRDDFRKMKQEKQ